MRQFFAVPAVEHHLLRKALLQVPKEMLQRPIAAARGHQAQVALFQKLRQAFVEQVQAFLPSQAAHHAEQGRGGGGRQPQAVQQRGLGRRFAAQVGGGEAVRYIGVVARVPFGIVHAVQYAHERITAVAQERVEAKAMFRRADFLRVRGADGSEAVGMQQRVQQCVDTPGMQVALVQLADAIA